MARTETEGRHRQESAGQCGAVALLTHEYPPHPHPVSVKKFLVFNELGQGYRCKFLIPQELFAESRL